MGNSCQLAPKAEIKAQFVPDGSGGGDLWLTASGKTPTPCWEVSIEQSPLTIWPPVFAVEACEIGDACPDVLAPYSVADSFHLGSAPKSVQVTDAEGPHDIPVEIVPDATVGALSDGSVVGVSMGVINLAEAISRAAAQLPRHPNHPNVGVAMTVEEIWYTNGGIVGPALYVRGKARS